jgi:hypothetical protein
MSAPIPDGIRPALGVRAWDAVDGPALESVFRSVVWPRNQRLVAECLSPISVFEGYRPTRPAGRWARLRGKTEAPERMHVIPRKHLSPSKNCSCGIYAGWFLEEAHHMGVIPQVRGWFGPGAPKISLRPRVFGVMAGWGRVVRGSKGFRAQYAKLVALFQPREGEHQDIEELAELYEVPIVNRNTYHYTWESA